VSKHFSNLFASYKQKSQIEFVTSGLFTVAPCTRYWGDMRRQVHRGLPPSQVPAYFKQFDWVLGFSWGWHNINEIPKYMYIRADLLDDTLDFVTDSSIDFSSSTIVFAGEDTKPSFFGREKILKLLSRCRDILWEANDFKELKTFPVALSEYYLRGYSKMFLELMTEKIPKTNLVKCSFGGVWPELSEVVPDRIELLRMLRNTSFVKNTVTEIPTYLQGLATSNYLLCPEGAGVQSPKVMEALLLGTIPVVTQNNTTADLSGRGMPLLILESWNSLTKTMLEDHLSVMSGRVQDFKSEVLLDQDQYFKFSLRLQ
jgi:hypothetical protein